MAVSQAVTVAVSAVWLAAIAGVGVSQALATWVGTGSTSTAGAEGAVVASGLAVGAESAMWFAAAAGGGALDALGSAANSGSTPVGVDGAVAWMGLVAAAAARAVRLGGGESPVLQTGRRGVCSPMLGRRQATSATHARLPEVQQLLLWASGHWRLLVT